MPPNPAPITKRKVLWVEDDDLIASVLNQKLISSGFDLMYAKNGEEALAMLAKAVPDAIVLDLILPGMSGFDTLQKIGADPGLKKVPVMILSNLSGPGDWERVHALGAKKFLVKAATSLDKVVTEIRELCATSERERLSPLD